jgi:DNA polymerase-3 subunit gamma/tau
MRDLMVIKSAGTESELLVLTAEQRQQASRLAEKFDVAALVYNITTLERLRQTLKYSDTPRALLDASLLRFALSEHFLNIDELLSQLKAGPTRQGVGPAVVPIKKKQIVDHNITSTATGKPTEPATDPATARSAVTSKKIDLLRLNDIQLIKSNWQNVLEIIAARLGGGSGGLLASAEPTRFEEGLLTIGFPRSAEMQKKMCESNSRMAQIQSLLSEHCGTDIRLKFETAADEQTQTEPAANQPKTTPATARSAVTSSQRRNELINDPAVRTVLMGLDATITGIDEDQQGGG